MKQIKETFPMRLAGELFDNCVAPLAENKNSKQANSYFPLHPDASLNSYFVRPSARKMCSADFELMDGKADKSLSEALASFWDKEEEPELAAMAPRLEEIAKAVVDETSKDDGSVDVLCYTLF